MTRLVSILILLFATLFSFSQNCFDFHKQFCLPAQSKFIYSVNSASVSYLYKSGQTRYIPFRLDAGKDYRLTVCTDSNFIGVAEFSILTEDERVLYDNSKSNYKLDMEFACQKTQDIQFVITAPKAVSGISDTIMVEGCIGLLIEEMVSIKTGF
jgi:hypothetical protein